MQRPEQTLVFTSGVIEEHELNVETFCIAAKILKRYVGMVYMVFSRAESIVSVI